MKKFYKKRSPDRNRGRLPKLTAYEKKLNLFVITKTFANAMP